MKPTAIRVALVVGTTLFIVNHGAAVLEGKMNRDRWLAGLVTYLVPYTVSIHGQHASVRG
ncbi:MAG: nitrate/nitrite transporter NrtS [Nostoc sp.]|uniref:nitrate/nitrite transporter NrtS n=1 Tax=unclassified Nostoc TaxID=2593658 RepID=UPI0025E445F7|nr:nitrate/nitrite transporter NrtS [Nostoc sp. NMS7]MBN3948976.1 nitrate/nitrite transporter NrtS [Nostoc sp. NMS7]